MLSFIPTFFAGNKNDNSIVSFLKRIGGLTFYKNYNSTNINADYSIGSPTGTFTCIRGATAPGSYIDESGKIIVTTTANTPRITYGYYDSSGFHSNVGVLIERNETNLFENGMFDGNNIVDGVNINYDTSSTWSLDTLNLGAATLSLSTDSLYNTSISLAITNSGSANTDIAFRNSHLVTLVTSSNYMLSFMAKATTELTIAIASVKGDTVTNSGLDTTFDTIANTWIRINKPFVSAASDAWSYVEFYLGANGLYTIQFDAFQLNVSSSSVVSANPTSFIPTTTTFLQRRADKLSYVTLNNRTNSQETIIVEYSMTGLNATSYIVTTDNDKRYLQDNGNYQSFSPNFSSSSACKSESSRILFPNENRVLCATGQSGIVPYSSVYYNGGYYQRNDSTDDFKTNSLGANFYIGSDGSSSQLNGTIKKIAIFNRVLSPAEINLVVELMCNKNINRSLLGLGDSITYSNAPTMEKTFRDTHALVGSGKSTDTNTGGKSGDHSEDIINRVNFELPFLLSPYKKVIAFAIGTNDISDSIASSTTITNILNTITTINAYDSGIDVFTALITPRNDAKDATTTTFNECLSAALTSYQAIKSNLYIVDLNAAIKTNLNWDTALIGSGDVHPTAAGYQVIANAWKSAIVGI